MQHEILVDEDEISEHHEDDVNDVIEEMREDNCNESSGEDSEDNDEDNDGGNEEGMAVENRADEVVVVKGSTTQLVDQVRTTKSLLLSKPHDYATNLPENTHVQSVSAKGVWIKPL